MISGASLSSLLDFFELTGFSYGVRSATEPTTNHKGALPGPVPGSKTAFW